MQSPPLLERLDESPGKRLLLTWRSTHPLRCPPCTHLIHSPPPSHTLRARKWAFYFIFKNRITTCLCLFTPSRVPSPPPLSDKPGLACHTQFEWHLLSKSFLPLRMEWSFPNIYGLKSSRLPLDFSFEDFSGISRSNG